MPLAGMSYNARRHLESTTHEPYHMRQLWISKALKKIATVSALNNTAATQTSQQKRKKPADNVQSRDEVHRMQTTCMLRCLTGTTKPEHDLSY
mmetsp:Transcript_16828/g.29034  ORF Transcript_16828/g.29034 Transcript_16828/m.29034 type:complete len:93 (-) Transcript_16828:31-309(-)